MQNHILSIILFTPLLGALVSPVCAGDEQGRRPLGGQYLLSRRLPDFAAAGADVLDSASIPRSSFKFVEGTANNWIPSIGAG